MSSLKTARAVFIFPFALLVSSFFGCATAPSKTPAEQRSDEQLAQSVLQALHADSTLYARHINVRADNGAVTLSGYVWTTEELAQAKQDAQTVEGVKKIVDRMKVDRGAVQNATNGP